MSVKAAILGAGNMGKGHAKRLLESGAQISCVCDKSRAAREAFGMADRKSTRLNSSHCD